MIYSQAPSNSVFTNFICSMSSLSSVIGMSTNKKDKHHANRGAHRHSITASSGKKHKKDAEKDTDSDSISSSASTVASPVPPKLQCPLRPYVQPLFDAMFEPDSSEKQHEDPKNASTCPLRRIRMSHTVPLFTILMMNLWLIALSLLLTAMCRWIYMISIRGSIIIEQIWVSFVTAYPTHSDYERDGTNNREIPSTRPPSNSGASTISLD